jgi:hypothetical protein
VPGGRGRLTGRSGAKGGEAVSDLAIATFSEITLDERQGKGFCGIAAGLDFQRIQLPQQLLPGREARNQPPCSRYRPVGQTNAVRRAGLHSGGGCWVQRESVEFVAHGWFRDEPVVVGRGYLSARPIGQPIIPMELSASRDGSIRPLKRYPIPATADFRAVGAVRDAG